MVVDLFAAKFIEVYDHRTTGMFPMFPVYKRYDPNTYTSMVPVLLLQLVVLYLFHAIRASPLPPSGLLLGSEESLSTKKHHLGDLQGLADGKQRIPDCGDGMKPKTRERLVKTIQAKNPKLEYDCRLEEEALLGYTGSFGSAHEEAPAQPRMSISSGLELSYTADRRKGYKLRDFLRETANVWGSILATKYDCQLEAHTGLEVLANKQGEEFVAVPLARIRTFSYKARKRSNYRVRNVIKDALKSWRKDLKALDSRKKYGCNFGTSRTHYFVACYFD
ncbi:hypothetical protein Aduo_014476 [Ancylostoma duodenale]